MNHHEQIQFRPVQSRWSVCALACLALGLSSFTPAGTPAVRPAVVEAAEPVDVTLETAATAAPTPSSALLGTRRNATPPSADRDHQWANDVADAVAYFQRHRSRLTESEIQRVAEVLVDTAAQYGLETELVLAVVHVESRGNSFAVSPVGAMGLMQIMPATGEELAAELGIPWVGAQQLFEPEINVRLGIAYLRQLRQRFGNWSTALAAYNWGPGQISRRLRTGVALPVVYSTSVLEAKRDHI